jgi:hypothetical protein
MNSYFDFIIWFLCFNSYFSISAPAARAVRMRIFMACRWHMQLLFVGSCILCVHFNQHALIKTVARCGRCGCCGGSSIVVLFTLSCDKAISFEELTSFAFHVCLEVNVRQDVEAGQGLVEVCICDRCDARVWGPPVGAEDEEGFNVGDQALGDLRAGGRVCCYSPSDTAAAQRRRRTCW